MLWIENTIHIWILWMMKLEVERTMYVFMGIVIGHDNNARWVYVSTY